MPTFIFGAKPGLLQHCTVWQSTVVIYGKNWNKIQTNRFTNSILLLLSRTRIIVLIGTMTLRNGPITLSALGMEDKTESYGCLWALCSLGDIKLVIKFLHLASKFYLIFVIIQINYLYIKQKKNFKVKSICELLHWYRIKRRFLILLMLLLVVILSSRVVKSS